MPLGFGHLDLPVLKHHVVVQTGPKTWKVLYYRYGSSAVSAAGVKYMVPVYLPVDGTFHDLPAALKAAVQYETVE